MTEPNGYFEHKTKDGDRWDLLAYKYYGDQYKQKILLQANRHLFNDDLAIPPMILSSSITLIIPVLDKEFDDAGLPPWKRKNPDYEI